MSQVPEPRRMAIHQAGHAIVQALVGRGRFRVSRVALGREANAAWPDHEALGAASLDRETFLSIYEFGLVTLAGIAAEERYMATQPPEEEPLVALSDLAEWQQAADRLFAQPGQRQLVGLNIMRKLHEWFAEPSIWHILETLATELLEHGALDEVALEKILDPLRTTKESP